MSRRITRTRVFTRPIPPTLAQALLSGPLQALPDGADGGNGVYVYGNTAFPSNTYQASNYWVDIVFATSLPPDTTPPTVLATTPKAGVQKVATNTSLTATFSENVNSSTVTASHLRAPRPE